MHMYMCVCACHVKVYVHVLDHGLINQSCRPLRDDEVLPVRQHRVVPQGPTAEEEEQEVSDVLTVY